MARQAGTVRYSVLVEIVKILLSMFLFFMVLIKIQSGLQLLSTLHSPPTSPFQKINMCTFLQDYEGLCQYFKYLQLMSEEKIKLRLHNARQKLQGLFPDDPRGDIRVTFGKRQFKLQKAFLRLQSGYFKRAFLPNTQTLQVKQDLDENCFANVMKCFYGFTVQLSRNELLDYYPVLRFLEVEALLKVIRDDVAARGETYDVFVLLQAAHRFSEQELFQVGLAQLERQGYEQLRYSKLQLLRCPTELFKIIVKTHNRLKGETGKGISILQVDQLIRDFSDEHKLTEQQSQQLKFELIDKKSLNSQEYKQIFLDDAKRKRNSNQYTSMIKLQPDNNLFNSGLNQQLLFAGKLTESVIEPMKKISDEFTLELENTYEKKKNEELQAENTYLTAELNDLTSKSVEHAASIDYLKDLVGRLQGRLEEKDRIDKDQNNIIKRLQKMCNDLKGQISARNELIRKLEDRLLKIERLPSKQIANSKRITSTNQDQGTSKTIQSQIVPGHLLKDIAKQSMNDPTKTVTNFKKEKTAAHAAPLEIQAELELDDEDIESMYQSRLQFDKEPIGCPKKYLPKLANLMTTDGFQKKRLTLLFRRHINGQETCGKPSDIFNKGSLLVLICTRSDQIIGGFTSIEVTKNSNGYLADQNAFIFSLSRNQKFSIRQSHISQAIYLAPDYLIGFSNDIMISVDCLKTQCECSWPDAYQTNGEKRVSKWLTGEQGSFMAKSVQVYEVGEQQMIMDL